MPVKAVIDNNVWVSGLLNPGTARQIVEALKVGLFTLVTCDEIMYELVQVLKRPKVAVKIREYKI